MNTFSRNILLLGVFITGVVSQDADVKDIFNVDSKCGANQVYTECGSGCGDLKCGQRKPLICPAMCFIGCICKEGFVRNAENECILPEDCPSPECGPNSAFTSCGSACHATCDNPYQKDQVCTLQCFIGCSCKPGFVKSKSGDCIPIGDCSSAECAKENEEYLLSGSPCQPSCDTDPNVQILCVENRAGCFCKKGYVRNSKGNCILKAMCPAKCKLNEVWKDCGPTGGSLTCKNYLSPPPTDRKCNRGCYCKDGYVKNLKGSCILTQNCPVSV